MGERTLGSAAQQPSRIGRMDEGSITMATGVVVVYFSRFGKPLQTHHKVVLELGAKSIAKIKGYDFSGHYESGCDYSDPLFFVPGDTLLLDEASRLGIRSANDLYGDVVFAPSQDVEHREAYNREP